MNEQWKNSVRNLENLLSIVAGLSLSLAVYQVMDTSGQGFPIRPAALPFFGVFVVTLVPFYHGALAHLDHTYGSERELGAEAGALMVDFVMLFLEACLVVALALLIGSGRFFVWGIVALLAFDIVWGLLAHVAFPANRELNAEKRWACINLATGVSIVIIAMFGEAVGLGQVRLGIVLFAVALTRTVVDYCLCWELYYPMGEGGRREVRAPRGDNPRRAGRRRG